MVSFKSAAEGLAAVIARSGPGRRGVRNRVLVLAYHNIVPDAEPRIGDRSLHLSLSAFRSQLGFLSSVLDVVPLTEAFSGPGAPGRSRAVITFDDAYCGAVTLGAEALARYGLPATYFVAPGTLGKPFWWDTYAPLDSPWDPAVRARLLTGMAGRASAITEWAAEIGLRATSPGDWRRAATETELRDSLARPELDLGSHSWSHPNLAALTGPALDDELALPLAWLRERFSAVLPWLAYPYGLASDGVARAAAAAGYSAALAVSGGWWPRRVGDPFALPRWNVPAGISLSGFKLRVSGWLCR